MKPFLLIRKRMFIAFFFLTACLYAQVNTGGNATTANHQKQVIGYITNWDAWKNNRAGVPGAGALTHLNIDYSKYTILNYSFFGVARDGSLHSGDHRNKSIYKDGVSQEPKDIFFKDIYSSWDLHILFGEIEPLQYINEEAKRRAEAQGFQVAVNGTSWTQPTWGLSGGLPLPLHKETGAPGLLELAHQNGVKVMASIGGWSMCKHFPEMAADPVKRARFIEDCKKLIATGFDGIDLDWEYPGPYSGMNFTGTPEDFANFEILVEEIRAAIGPDKLITSCFSADPRKLDGFNWGRLVNSMDYFNMMTYDFNGGWSNKAGHNAPIYPYTDAEVPFFNWQSTLQKLNQLGVPKGKICMGSPFYGRGVVTDGPADLNVKTVKRNETVQPDGPIVTAADYTNWKKEVYDGTPNYFFIKQKALSPNSGWTRKWDNEAKVPYLVKGNYFLSYDDEESIGIKAQFINDNSLGGTIVWTVYGDLEFGGSVTSYGTKLKKWSNVKSPLVNKINDVFANGNGGGNVAPTVSITDPLNNAVFQVGDTITVKANASDSNGTVTKVEFFNGATKLSEDTTSPYSHVITNAQVGTYNFTAKATDNEGASTTSTVVKVTVKDGTQNVAPEASITSPKNGDSFVEGTAVTIEAKATDVDGTIAKVEFFKGATKLGEVTASPYNYVVNGLTVGKYSFTVKATDDLGASTTSAAVEIDVTKDSTGPCDKYPVWSPSEAYPTGTDVKHNNIHYRNRWWSRNQNPSTNSGPWQVWEEIGPCDGGSGTNKPPKVKIDSPVTGTTLDNGATINIQASASDSDGTVAKVEFYNGATKLGEDLSAPYAYSIANAPEGEYNLTAKATDDKGASTTSVNVVVTVKSGTTGGCAGVVQYVAGTSYQQNQEVQNQGAKYSCKVAGWCSSASGWAYAPGTGMYWDHAWTKVGTCTAPVVGNKLEVYPNPVLSKLTLLNSKESSAIAGSVEVQLEVYNISGVQVINSNVNSNNGSITYDVSSLRKGLYFYVVHYGQVKYEGKFVKAE
ncbi:glycosyl hydrolase family 18 protein [Tenacibaculum xiamenense]|uniref:glycosyl hydrolase family 18 protein n=1 Tax=Tenacibaculum xiamenense TaxID=1261553 RepID=UPI003894A930